MVKKIQKIIPMREKCLCGKRVKNHHWLCDKCYSKKKKLEKRVNTAKLCRNKERYLKWKNALKEFKREEYEHKLKQKK